MIQTPQEALDLLDRAVSALNATRADHGTLQQAIMILRRAISQPQPNMALVPPVGEPEAANGG